MKNIFTLTAILIAHLMFSQIIPTKEQEKKIQQVTTPDRLIEYSKGLSNEKRQSKVIDSLQNVIKSKDKEIFNLIKKHREDLLSIARNRDIVEDTTNQIDNIDTEAKESKFAIHLYGNLETPEIKFNSVKASLDLLFDFKKFEIGLRGGIYKSIKNSDFEHSLLLRYKFF